MDNNKLRERLKKYRYDTEISYKKVATETEIPYSTFYNFSSGLRDLKEKYYLSLDSYLVGKGY